MTYFELFSGFILSAIPIPAHYLADFLVCFNMAYDLVDGVFPVSPSVQRCVLRFILFVRFRLSFLVSVFYFMLVSGCVVRVLWLELTVL